MNHEPSTMNSKNTLLIGIGNNGRRDDGLGWAFADAIEKSGLFQGEVHLCYQLQVEDAEKISHADQVIFVDAYQGHLSEGFEWVSCRPSPNFTFTTHAFTPTSILFLCQELYHKLPPAYVFMIQGQEWGLGKGLSEHAGENLEKALTHFKEKLLAVNV
jgi:hydrogenase maturation protease